MTVVSPSFKYIPLSTFSYVIILVSTNRGYSSDDRILHLS